jgi:hypothetical protein
VEADAQGQPLPDLGISNVIVSTVNAHSVFFKMLSSATQSIWAQTEELGDPCNGYLAYPILQVRCEQRFSIGFACYVLKVYASIFDLL